MAMRCMNEMGEFESDPSWDPDERRGEVYASLRRSDPSKMRPEMGILEQEIRERRDRRRRR